MTPRAMCLEMRGNLDDLWVDRRLLAFRSLRRERKIEKFRTVV